MRKDDTICLILSKWPSFSIPTKENPDTEPNNDESFGIRPEIFFFLEQQDLVATCKLKDKIKQQ